MNETSTIELNAWYLLRNGVLMLNCTSSRRNSNTLTITKSNMSFTNIRF